MSFFEFFDIPVSFYPDQDDLRSKFLANSKKFHPDIYQGDSPFDAGQNISLNNKGYSVLSKFNTTVDYILNEVYPAEGKAELPQEFLMEMMDINEAVMDLQFDNDEAKREEIEAESEKLEQDLEQELERVSKAFEVGNSSQIEVIRTAYLKLKYVRRLSDSIKKQK
jgi:molecular chaperone HscB